MLKFDREELIPVVIQDHATKEVLMAAFMNEEAFRLTCETGYTHFFSRSRNTLWRKGEQSGNVQEVRALFVNCEENSLLIHIVQHGETACHTGYRSCYYRRLLADGSYETVAERIFDPEVVYGALHQTPSVVENQLHIATKTTYTEAHTEALETQFIAPLEGTMRPLYAVYLYLRDHDLSEQSNTSRLLQEHDHGYLVARLGDELQELAEVQSGEHVHSGRQPDTILEGSQVGYWLLLLAASNHLGYDAFTPHASILHGYYDNDSEEKAIEQRQQCLDLLTANANEVATIVQGLDLGFALIGWACAKAGVSPVAPAEFDLGQMRKKGRVG